MSEVEEAVIKSPLLDNPIFLDAIRTVFGFADVGTSTGFQDGLNGIPKRQHAPDVPELFTICYERSYLQGEAARVIREELEDAEARKLEIAMYEERLGHCLDSNRNNSRSVPVVQSKAKEGKQVEESLVQAKEPQESIIKKVMGYIIACTITGVACGLIGVAVGKKQAMKVQRDLGVTDQTSR